MSISAFPPPASPSFRTQNTGALSHDKQASAGVRDLASSSRLTQRLDTINTLLAAQLATMTGLSAYTDVPLSPFIKFLNQLQKEYQYLEKLALLPRITAQLPPKRLIAVSGVAGPKPRPIQTGGSSKKGLKAPHASESVSIVHQRVADALSDCNIVILTQGNHDAAAQAVVDSLEPDVLVSLLHHAGIMTVFCEQLHTEHIAKLASNHLSPVLYYLDSHVYKRPVGSTSPSGKVVDFLQLCLEKHIALAPMGDYTYELYEHNTHMKPLSLKLIDIIHHSYYPCVQLKLLTFSFLAGVPIPLPPTV